MSSRGKKKKQWKEAKELEHQKAIDWYDSILNNLEQIKKDYQDGKYTIGVDLANGENKTIKRGLRRECNFYEDEYER